MATLGEVVVQVAAFATGLLAVSYLGVGVYMRVSHHDLLTGKAAAQPRSNFQWLSGFFSSLMLFTVFLGQALPHELDYVRVALLVLGVLFMGFFIFFLIKLLRTRAA